MVGFLVWFWVVVGVFLSSFFFFTFLSVPRKLTFLHQLSARLANNALNATFKQVLTYIALQILHVHISYTKYEVVTSYTISTLNKKNISFFLPSVHLSIQNLILSIVKINLLTS